MEKLSKTQKRVLFALFRNNFRGAWWTHTIGDAAIDVLGFEPQIRTLEALLRKGYLELHPDHEQSPGTRTVFSQAAKDLYALEVLKPLSNETKRSVIKIHKVVYLDDLIVAVWNKYLYRHASTNFDHEDYIDREIKPLLKNLTPATLLNAAQSHAHTRDEYEETEYNGLEYSLYRELKEELAKTIKLRLLELLPDWQE